MKNTQSKLNAEWHKEHHMPPKATAKQRLVWHTEHAKNCLCRPFTPKMKQKLEESINS